MDKVLCRYCGAEMHLVLDEVPGLNFAYTGLHNGNFACGCGAQSPRVRDMSSEDVRESAYAAAMQRYIEPNRVLTLDEVVAWGNAEARPVYIELNAPNGQARMHVGLYGGVTDVSIAMYTSAEDWQLMPQNRYGERYRFWLRRPTDEERQSVAWEESQ